MRREAIVLVWVLASACASSIGSPFPADGVDEIRIGETERQEIREQLGPPWQVGIEDGQVAWAYVFYRRSLLGSEARNLVVLFDDTGRVTSYRFHTTVGREHAP
jgi:outer membrane protein assembly factor BamE (lipoprotein component of BamABCDE complex)